MGDENTTVDPAEQKRLMELYANNPDAYYAEMAKRNKQVDTVNKSAGGVIDDVSSAASNAGKSLMSLFGGGSQAPSKPLGDEINDNLQMLAKRKALQRLQNQGSGQ